MSRQPVPSPMGPSHAAAATQDRQSRLASRRNGSDPRRRLITVVVAIVAVAAIAVGIIVYDANSEPSGPLPVRLPPAAGSYLGVYAQGLPASYSPVSAFASTIGAKPDIVMYYSGWYVPFPTSFATTVAKNGAAPLVQINPEQNGKGISLTAIAAGQYDGYLSAYAEAIRGYGHPVILSFGHEMNGNWEPWGYQHATPASFIAAWRHIVNVFRALGVKNVTWLWTANIVSDTPTSKIPNPAPWWPGSSYVDWVGIDGYYLKSSWEFAPLFGPTIRAVRALTSAPILIAETGALPAAGQPAKIADLFAGVRSYGLLGFVYFNDTNSLGTSYGLSSQNAINAFRKGASQYHRPG
jgi:hypothetical protein